MPTVQSTYRLGSVVEYKGISGGVTGPSTALWMCRYTNLRAQSYSELFGPYAVTLCSSSNYRLLICHQTITRGANHRTQHALHQHYSRSETTEKK